MFTDRVTDAAVLGQFPASTYALVRFFDDRGHPVDSTVATAIAVEWYDANDNLVGRQDPMLGGQ